MLEMLKERKAALEAQGKKGFTLMEMLIVIAIIAILIAIAIPVFTAQLESANDATTAANLRSAYAEATAMYMENKAGSGGQVTVNFTAKQGDSTLPASYVKDLPFTIGGEKKDTKITDGAHTVTFTFSGGAVDAEIDKSGGA